MFKTKTYQLLKKFEWFTHWLQIRFDRDNFWAARKLTFCNTCFFFSGLVFCAHYSYRDEAYITGFILGLCAGYVLRDQKITKLEIDKIETKTIKAVAGGCRNPVEELLPFMIKGGLVMFSVYNLVLYSTNIPAEVHAGFIITLTLASPLGLIRNFFVAVTPLHPNDVERKQLEKLEALPIIG